MKDAFLYYSLLFPFASQNVALGGGPGQEGNYAIPQAWSLTAEFVFYLMLPGASRSCSCASAAKKAPEVQVRYALADLRSCSTCSGRCSGSTSSLAEPSWERVAAIWAPNWVDFFAIGMATATYSAAHHAGLRLPSSAARSSATIPVVSWTIAGAVGLSFATFSPPDTPGVYGAEYWVRWFLFGVFAFFLLAPAMFGDQTQGRGRRFLASKPLVLLGTVSLGFYLFHLAVMTNVQEWLAPDGTSSVFYGSLPAVFSLTFVGADRAGVPELLPGGEAVPAAQGQAGVVVVAAPGRRAMTAPVSVEPDVGRALVDHPGVQRGGVAPRGAQGARRADARLRRAGRVRRVDRPHRRVAHAAGVHVAVLPFNLGIGGALRTGFTFAVRHGYERAVQFDADGQHDPLARADACSTGSTTAPTW